MRMLKIFITMLVGVAFGAPVHAIEIGDSVKFPTDSSFGCMWIEDAREAASYVARNGDLESSKSFVNELNEKFHPNVNRRPQMPKATSRFCDFFFAGSALFKYSVMKKSDDGYVCITAHPSWEDRCLWVDLKIWNVEVTPNRK